MSRVTFNTCDICDCIADNTTQVFSNHNMYDLCDKCYKNIESLVDLKNVYHKTIKEINNIIEEKLEVMRDERKEDII